MAEKTNLLQQLTEATRMRQVQSLATTQFAGQKAKEAASVKQVVTNEAAQVQKNLQQRRQRELHSRELQDSKNFGDRVKLEALRIFQPADYNPKVRNQRTQEDLAYLQDLSTTSNVKLQQIQADLVSAQAGLDLSKVSEEVALQRAQEATRLRQIQIDELSANNDLQELAVAQLGESQIRTYLNQPANEQGRYNVNGVEVTRDQLLGRSDSLRNRAIERENLSLLESLVDYNRNATEDQIAGQPDELKIRQLQRKERLAAAEYDRDYNEIVRPYNLRQAEATAAGQADEIEIANLDREGRLNAARIGKKYQSKETDAELEALNKQHKISVALKASQQRHVQTANIAELEQIVQNDYTSPDGVKYPRHIVDEELSRQKQVRTERINETVQKQLAAETPGQIISTAASQYEQLGSKFAEESPMRNHLRTAQIRIGQAKTILDAAKEEDGSVNPVLANQALTMIQESQKDFLKAAKTQAKTEAYGDKDVEAFLTQFYVNGEANTAQFTDILQSRLLKGQSLTNLLSPEDAAQLQDYFSEARAEIRRAPSVTESALEGKRSETDKKLLEEQAAVNAVNRMSRAKAQAIHRQTLADQVAFPTTRDDSTGITIPAHPLYNKMTPGQYAVEVTQASETALLSAADALGTSPEAIRKSLQQQENLAGPDGAIVTPDELTSTLNYMTSLSLVESLGTDTARAVTEWHEDYGDEYMRMSLARFSNTKGGASESAVFNLSRETALELWRENAFEFANANQAVQAERIDRVSSLAVGSDPVQYQATLLAMNEHLEDFERGLLWESIAPIAEIAAARGMQGVEAARYIESELDSLDLSSPAQKRAMKALMRSRDTDAEKLKILGIAVTTPGHNSYRIGFGGTALPTRSDALTKAFDSQRGRLKFYSDWQAQRSKQ